MNLIEKIGDLLERDYWGSAGAGILPIAFDTKRILVALRSANVNEPNTYGVWGGAIEFAEDPKRAAVREFREETDFRGSMKMIMAYEFTDGDFTFSNFIGIVEEEFKPKLDWETRDFEWLTFDELKKLTPLHFGLKGLLQKSGSLIRRHTK